jgi:peptidoglycan/LPS O-acetylase OafA/YrhL
MAAEPALPSRLQPGGRLGSLALPIIFLLIAGVGYLLYRFVEVPCIRISRRREIARTPEDPVQPRDGALADPVVSCLRNTR